MSLPETLAVASSLCYIGCNVPLTLRAIRSGHVRELQWTFLVLVACGQLLAIGAVLSAGKTLGLLLNYIPGLASFCYFMILKRKHG